MALVTRPAMPRTYQSAEALLLMVVRWEGGGGHLLGNAEVIKAARKCVRYSAL